MQFKDPEILNYRKRTFLFSLGFAIFLVVTFIGSWKYYEKRAEKDVSNSRPNAFPVVINTSGRSELIYLADVEKYKQRGLEFSFLVPDENAELINRQLKADQVKRGGKGVPRITARTIAEGRQLVEVEIRGDGLLDSRYEATDKDVKPLSFTLSGPGFIFLPFAATVGIGIVGFLLLQGALRWSKNARRLKLN